jgi:integrase
VPAKKLTAVFVENVRPAAAREEYWDDRNPGFGLRVGTSGAKSWMMLYRLNGQVVRETLGKYPTLGHADARALAAEREGMVQAGIDPRKPKATKTDTAADLASAFVAQHCKPNNKTWRAQESQLQMYVLARWGTRRPDSVSKLDVTQMLQEIAVKRGDKSGGKCRGGIAMGGPVAAENVLKVLRAVYNWALDHDIVEVNPAMRAKPPVRPASRDRVLSDDEVRAVWNAALELGYPFGHWTRLLLATGQRRTEVAAMTWDEVEGDMWVMPKERTKAARAHVVPLSQIALDILSECPRPSGPHICSTCAGTNHIRGYSKAKVEFDASV